MFYVIGIYSDGTASILSEELTIKRAQAAIGWQGQPRGDIKWLSPVRALTWNSGSRHFNVKTEFVICRPSFKKGVFVAMDTFKDIDTKRGAFTQKAYDDITERACTNA